MERKSVVEELARAAAGAGDAVVRVLSNTFHLNSSNSDSSILKVEGNHSPLFPSTLNADVLHELLNGCTSIFWLFAYASLFQKLRQEHSARGVSLQSLLALMLTELSNLLILLILYFKFQIPVSLFLLFCDSTSAALSALSYFKVVRKFAASYEEEKDSFGLVFCPFFRRNDARTQRNGSSTFHGGPLTPKFLTIRLHWLTIYALATVMGLGLYALRFSRLPFWLSYWECVTDSVTALALLPQLFLFYNRRPRRISNLLGRFVILLLCARLSALAYWVSDVFLRVEGVPGRYLHIVSEVLNVLILLDFAYYYTLARYLGPSGSKDVTLPV